MTWDAAVALMRRLDINATLRAAGRPVTEVDLDHTAELFAELDEVDLFQLRADVDEIIDPAL